MAGKINMQRVAEAAGVSKSSVSLALRDDPRLAPATRRRVQEAAARLGYRKNPVVASLMAQLRVSQTPKFQANVALINCSPRRNLFEEPRFAEMRKGIEARLDLSGYGIDEFWVGDNMLSAQRLRQVLETRGVKGIILLTTLDSPPIFPGESAVFEDFCAVVAGFDRAAVTLNRAAGNDFHTSRAALDAAIELGFHRPGLVLDNGLDKALNRGWSAGFLAGLQDAPVTANNRPMPLFMDSPRREPFLQWLESEKPDVIITDQVDVMDWVKSINLRVPEDVGLIHLDLQPGMAEWAGMRQNRELVGAAAADLVLHQLSRNEYGARDHAKLVLTESEFAIGPSARR